MREAHLLYNRAVVNANREQGLVGANSTQRAQQTDAETSTERALEWTHHPWKATPLKMIALWIINLGITAIVYFSFPEKLFALLAFLVLFGSTMSIYLPIRYRFTPEGVTVFFLGVPSFRPWKHYHQAYVHENGVFLTSMPRPSRLDPFRGHFLKYAGNREAVVNYVRRFISKKG